MDIQDLLPAELASAATAAALKALIRIYDEADAACAAFLSSARGRFPAATEGPAAAGSRAFGCPEGCGSCCERFVPDMLPVEADLAALWILRYRPDLASVDARKTAPCPYYAAEKSEAHCGIYGARPLICRLFGFSASSAKDGALSFSLCREMPPPGGTERRSWEGKALEGSFDLPPPLMADFGMRLESLSPPGLRPRTFLAEAIRSSLDMFGLRLSLARA